MKFLLRYLRRPWPIFTVLCHVVEHFPINFQIPDLFRFSLCHGAKTVNAEGTHAGRHIIYRLEVRNGPTVPPSQLLHWYGQSVTFLSPFQLSVIRLYRIVKTEHCFQGETTSPLPFQLPLHKPIVGRCSLKFTGISWHFPTFPETPCDSMNKRENRQKHVVRTIPYV